MVSVFARVETTIELTEEEFEKIVRYSKSRFTTRECEDEFYTILERRLPDKLGYIPGCYVEDTVRDLGWNIDEDDRFNDLDF